MAKDNANSTPEKQLLKLIEDPGAQTPLKGFARRRPYFSFSPAAFKGSAGFGRKILSSFTGGWNIKRANDLLTVAIIGFGFYFAFHTVTLYSKLSQIPSFSFKKEHAGKTDSLAYATRLDSLTSYLDKAAARDIFKIGKKPPVVETGSGQSRAAAAKEKEVLDRFRLVGISWSKNPDAMLEDTKTKKTYFLKRGQSVDGVRVEAVFKDKVVLGYGDEEVELR